MRRGGVLPRPPRFVQPLIDKCVGRAAPSPPPDNRRTPRQGTRALPYKKCGVGRDPCVPPPPYLMFSVGATLAVARGRGRAPPLRNSIVKWCVGDDAHIGPPHRAPCNTSVGATLAVARCTVPHVTVRRGRRLPTVVPTDSRPLLWPPIGALPRNQLASSATGGASPISPTPRFTALLVIRRGGRPCPPVVKSLKYA